MVSQCKLVSAGTGGELDYGNGARHHLVGHCCSGRTLVTCNAGASTYASVCRFSLSLTVIYLHRRSVISPPSLAMWTTLCAVSSTDWWQKPLHDRSAHHLLKYTYSVVKNNRSLFLIRLTVTTYRFVLHIYAFNAFTIWLLCFHQRLVAFCFQNAGVSIVIYFKYKQLIGISPNF